jgi:hypothetical protein
MAENQSTAAKVAAAATKDNPDGGTQKVDTTPLEGVQPFGVREAGGKESHKLLVGNDPHAFEAIPGATGPEAVGSGQPLPSAATEGMKARLDAGIPEPPKVGPIPNTDLYDTPGGYQVVPAGFDPYGLEKANEETAAAFRAPADPSKLGAEVKKVAGSGSKTVKGN